MVTFASWWFSSTIQGRATELEIQVTDILRENEQAETFTLIDRALQNLDKRGMRIESRLTSPERPKEAHFTNDQALLYSSFTHAGDEQMWADILSGDLFNTYREFQRTERYLETLHGGFCPSEPTSTDATIDDVNKCVARLALPASITAPVIAAVSAIEVPAYRPQCLQDKIKRANTDFDQIYAAFTSSQKVVRETALAAPVSIDPPDFDAMSRALPVLEAGSRIVRSCIAKPYETINFEIDRYRQQLIIWARTDLLPRRQVEANIANGVAALLYVMSAALGIYSAWAKAKKEASSPEES